MSRINLNAVIVGIVLLTFAIAICDAGENSGRKMYVMQAKKANWSEAIKHCRKRKMEVVSIKSEQENEEFVQKIAKTGWENVWTSGKDVEGDGFFQWVPIAQDFTYENWLEGQASREFDEETMEEAFCVEVLLANNRGKWHDDLCSAEKNFVCEKYQQPRRPPPVFEYPTTSIIGIRRDWLLKEVAQIKPIEKATVRQSKKAYAIYMTALNANQSEQYCENTNGNLASITSAEVENEVAEVITKSHLILKEGAWILTQNTSASGTWCSQVFYNIESRKITRGWERCSNEQQVICEYIR